MLASDKPLAGTTIVVTRPIAQAQALCRLIDAAGGEAIALPVLAIEGRNIAPPPLPDYQLAIFVSANAVEHAHRLLGGDWPASLPMAAVGKATARALAATWSQPVLQPPTGFNSESLLAMPELQLVAGKRILIFRGEGGRELLAETLRQRGAQVDYAEVYRRLRPQVSLASLQALPRVDFITATSNETLQNLYDLAGEDAVRPWLLQQRLLVVSPRAIDLARQLGFAHTPVLAEAPGDESLIKAIVSCRRGAAS